MDMIAPAHSSDGRRGGAPRSALASLAFAGTLLSASAIPGFIPANASTQAGAPARLKDCDDVCPTMVVAPAGAFEMGSTTRDDEKPIRRVVFMSPFAIAETEITFAQWDACVADGGCPASRRGAAVAGDHGWGRADRPVINVTWSEANAYARWLSEKTGETYRLPTESEWEYAAKAGPEVQPDPAAANYAASDLGRTQPVGAYAPNALGLRDMMGNVWEWVEDCYVSSYEGAPTDGSARTMRRCDRRVLRGGAWNAPAEHLRPAMRGRNPEGQRGEDFGFRVVREIRGR